MPMNLSQEPGCSPIRWVLRRGLRLLKKIRLAVLVLEIMILRPNGAKKVPSIPLARRGKSESEMIRLGQVVTMLLTL